MEEKKLSKYAEKVLARGNEPPAPVPPPADAEDDEFADLGQLPGLCAGHLLAAAGELAMARSVAAEMERLAKPGVQRQEPIGIKGACSAMAKRIRSLAKRAERLR